MKNAKRDHLINSQILFTKEFIQSLHMTQFPATCSMRIRIWSNIYSKWGWWECYSYNLCIKAEAEWKVLCI